MSNAYVHSEISVKRHGGKIEDYYGLHDLMDCSKEVESTNKHRIFHNLWGVKNVIIPIIGHTIVNSDGKPCNVKDICESDHILQDYGNKFIPTLQDFVDCIEDDETDKEAIHQFQLENIEFFNENPQVKELLMSPLWNTGKIKSLLITHNSWFIGHILPKVFKNIKPQVKSFSVSPQKLFARMSFPSWMNNGHGIPPSFEKIYRDKKEKESGKSLGEKFSEVFKKSQPTYDGKGYVSVMDGSPHIPLTEEMRTIPQFDDAAREMIIDGSPIRHSPIVGGLRD